MLKSYVAILVTLFFASCSQKGIRRDFFIQSKGFQDFSSSNGRLPLFGFDSLMIDSLSTSIDGQEYWYLHPGPNALFNIDGYLRDSSYIIYIRPGDQARDDSSNEQVLFNFSGDTTKSWTVEYQRGSIEQRIRMIRDRHFYNELIQDSVFIFQVQREEKNTSYFREFFIQASLKKGFVSFRHLSRGVQRLYTIDYLPFVKISYDSITASLDPDL